MSLTCRLAWLLLSIIFTGCVGVGNPSTLEQDRLQQLEINRSTREDIQTVLGTPSYQSGPLTPVEIIRYEYAGVEITPLTYLPLLGPFLGASPFQRGAISMQLDTQGILQIIQADHSKD